jgi:hypothetical protein
LVFVGGDVKFRSMLLISIASEDFLRNNVAPLLTAAFLVAANVSFGQTHSLILSSGSTTPDGTVSLNLNLTSTNGRIPVGIQWTLTYSPSDVTAISVTAGPAATAAGKTLSCFASLGTYTCLASGMNTTAISNGAVAYVDLTIAAGVSATSVGLTNSSGSAAKGGRILVLPTGGVVTEGAASPPRR